MTLRALIINNGIAGDLDRNLHYQFLAMGQMVAVFGDSSLQWLNAECADRPFKDYWWVTDPSKLKTSHTNQKHPVFHGLKPRHDSLSEWLFGIRPSGRFEVLSDAYPAAPGLFSPQTRANQRLAPADTSSQPLTAMRGA